MTTYKYRAVSHSGMEIEGVIEAHDRDDAVIRLRESCASVLNLAEVREGITLGDPTKRRIKGKDLALVCQQFSIILTAGIPIVRAVELVAEQASDKALRELLKSVAKDVAAGYSLASGFEMRSKTLPTTFIETIRAGEESGSLELSFSRLAEYFSKRSKIRSKVVTSLAYPIFVIIVAVIVITIIMIYAVPTFTRTFESMGVDLPWATKVLIGVSDFFSKYILIVLAFIGIAIIGLRIYYHTEGGHVRLSKFSLSVPVLGRINFMNAASQFSNTFSTMLASGLPVMRALNVTGRGMSNYYLGQSVIEIIAGIEAGRRIGECMADAKRFPNLLVEMTKVGEESGSLEETLHVVGDYYDAEVEGASARAVSLLEPIIICVLAVFVVLVLLAVYLPMFGMYGSI